MGYFKNIKLNNFRNFNEYYLEFSKNCNVFFGKNGSGKTNLLEALSISTKGRGIRKDKISNFIKKDKTKFINILTFMDSEIEYQIKNISESNKDKIIKKTYLNNELSKDANLKIESLITFLVYLPENERLFTASPNTRREFIDHFMSTNNINYNKIINFYKKNLYERNIILNEKTKDVEWIDKIEDNISKSGIEIYKFRQRQIDLFEKNLEKLNELFDLSFKMKIKPIDSFLNDKLSTENFKIKLAHNRNIDKMIGGSKIGPHKTDYIFLVDQIPASQLSTGQQKTLVLLLYLAQCNYLIKNCKIKPILLLDEICSHLDDINRNILLKIVNEFNIQVFMTGTTKDLFSFLSTNTKFYNISL